MRNISMGKLPPQALDAEVAVLGALMLDSSSFHQISTFVSSESFYTDQNREVFNAIASLNAQNRPVDFITVAQSLRESGKLELVGGPFYITNLTAHVSSAANIETHALYVREKFMQREMIRICTEAIEDAYNDTTDVMDLYDQVGNDLFMQSATNIGKEAAPIKDVVVQRLEAYEKPTPQGLTGVGTGFTELNRITSGWQKQDLIILAARPGMGKTAMALNLVRNAAVMHDMPCAIFSLEMSKESLVDRMISAETEVYFSKFKSRDFSQMDWKDIHDNINGLLESKIFIDDSSALSIQAFRSKAIRLKHSHNIQFIIVDYLQLMTDKTKGNNREQEISSISRGLKSVAKDLDIPVLALSQLSRKVEERPGLQGKRPLLSDLRESGSIEQDADQVWFLYRPEYYGIEEDEQGRSLAGLCEAIFAKNRQGPLDTAPMRFNGAKMKFGDIEIEQPAFTLPPPVNYSEPQNEHKEFTIMPSKYFDEDGDPPF